MNFMNRIYESHGTVRTHLRHTRSKARRESVTCQYTFHLHPPSHPQPHPLLYLIRCLIRYLVPSTPLRTSTSEGGAAGGVIQRCARRCACLAAAPLRSTPLVASLSRCRWSLACACTRVHSRSACSSDSKQQRCSALFDEKNNSSFAPAHGTNKQSNKQTHRSDGEHECKSPHIRSHCRHMTLTHTMTLTNIDRHAHAFNTSQDREKVG